MQQINNWSKNDIENMIKKKIKIRVSPIEKELIIIRNKLIDLEKMMESRESKIIPLEKNKK